MGLRDIVTANTNKEYQAKLRELDEKEDELIKEKGKYIATQKCLEDIIEPLQAIKAEEEKFFENIKRLNADPQLETDVKYVLKKMKELLSKLPDILACEFAESENYKIYKSLLRAYKV